MEILTEILKESLLKDELDIWKNKIQGNVKRNNDGE